MHEFFHNHGNKIIAVVGAALALTFVLPGNPMNGGPGSSRLGTVNGHHVTTDELRDAQNLIHSVERIMLPPQQSQFGQPMPPMTLAEVIFRSSRMSKNQYDQLKQNPLLVHLLLAEARRAGAAVDDRALDRFFSDPVRVVYDASKEPMKMSDASDTLRAGLREDARRLASILAYFNRIDAAFKYSKPLVNDTVARQHQQVKLRVASFDAKTFADKIAAPTEDELQRQFTAYADKEPLVNDLNPFGFGYRVPDRVAVQWLVVPDAEARKVVDASKSEQDWQVEARVYYRKNPTQFQTTSSPAATPTTNPTTKPYLDVAAEALRAVKEPEVERLKRKAAAAIVQQINIDYQKASHTPATQQAATAFGPAFGSFDYLQKLADQVQKQTGVRPTAVAPKGLLTQTDLVTQAGLGKAMLPDAARQFPSASDVVFRGLRAFQTEPTALSFDVGQPSPILTGDDGLYVVRVTEADRSHPAKQLADVRDDVTRDVRRTKAYTAAEEAAKAALAKAAGGLDGLGVPVQSATDFYGIGQPAPAGLPDPLASGVIGPAFEALRGVTSSSALPVRTIAKLRRDGIAAVVEVIAVKTDVNTADEAQFRNAANEMLVSETAPDFGALAAQWFNFDNVSRRTGYVPDKTEEPSAPKNAPKPANPLMPG